MIEMVNKEEEIRIQQIVEKYLNQPIDVKIKYLDPEGKRLTKIDKGDWIDVYAARDITIPKHDMAIIPLGFCMELPKGYEAHLLPRSSTYKKWGIIVANSMGIIDESYCGDHDEWGLVAYCLDGRDAHIYKGDKIAQFRIMRKMPQVNFVEVDHLGNKDRSGFGSTGKV